MLPKLGCKGRALQMSNDKSVNISTNIISNVNAAASANANSGAINMEL